MVYICTYKSLVKRIVLSPVETPFHAFKHLNVFRNSLIDSVTVNQVHHRVEYKSRTLNRNIIFFL